MIKPRVMRRLPECDCCLLSANAPFLVCAVHPNGPEGDSCLDFRPNHNLESEYFLADEEQWQPEGARFVDGELVIERSFYNGEEIVQPQPRWTPEEQLELLDWHPMFTGRCPECDHSFSSVPVPLVHYDCPICGWKDDTV